MAATMQVACKTFIAPNSAARSPEERYARVPIVQDNTLDVFLVECPTRGDGQVRDWSHLLELLLMRHPYRRSRLPRLLASTSRPRYSHSRMSPRRGVACRPRPSPDRFRGSAPAPTAFSP